MYMRIYARIGKNRLLSILLSRKEYGMSEKQIEQKLVQAEPPTPYADKVM